MRENTLDVIASLQFVLLTSDREQMATHTVKVSFQQFDLFNPLELLCFFNTWPLGIFLFAINTGGGDFVALKTLKEPFMVPERDSGSGVYSDTQLNDVSSL